MAAKLHGPNDARQHVFVMRRHTLHYETLSYMRQSFVDHIHTGCRDFQRPGFHGKAGRGVQGWADTDPVAGVNPSALAVSLISPGSRVDWTMICPRPLNTLRDHAEAVGWPTSSTFTSGLRPPVPDSFN